MVEAGGFTLSVVVLELGESFRDVVELERAMYEDDRMRAGRHGVCVGMPGLRPA